MSQNKSITLDYEHFLLWENYSEELLLEYRQSVEEGLEISNLKELFEAVSKLPVGEDKKRFADLLFDMVQRAKIQENYEYIEPSDWEEICSCCQKWEKELPNTEKLNLREHIKGAWYGRIVGCLLGKPVEGFHTEYLIPMLKNSENYPIHRYILSSEVPSELFEKYPYPLSQKCFIDQIDAAPCDDDTNYTVLYQQLVEQYGRNFTPADVARIWLDLQPKKAYCSAERVAYRNFVAGYFPPKSAVYQNPYREWIGAQIRADYFGYINPGRPILAAEMAWRDASISHTKNGIYGELFVAAMVSAAAVCEDILEIIQIGLSVVPKKSRFYENISKIIEFWKNAVSKEDCFSEIHAQWDEHNPHDWCHTISNAQIVTAALLYGENDFSRSICMAVDCGFDTDCNAATVGSILGMKNGYSSIDESWISPVNGQLKTAIFGMEQVSVEALVDKTLEHISNL